MPSPDRGLQDKIRAAPAHEAGVAADASAQTWREVREHEIRQMERERALRHILLDVGALCATASDADGLVRDVLTCTVMGLDALTGWVGVPAQGTEIVVCSPHGAEAHGPAVVETVERVACPLPGSPATRLGPEDTVGLPGESTGQVGLLARFRGQGPNQGWILITAQREPGLAHDLDGPLASIATFLGLAISRFGALDALRRLNLGLKSRVARQTQQIRHERDTLEVRVRERTQELERARREALETERRLLDLERRETVHRLAAGLAHEMNNPLGAVRAAQEYLLEELDLIRGGEAPSPTLLVELSDAVRDSLSSVNDMAQQIESVFGLAKASRREAVRTPLTEALENAIRLYRRSVPGAVPIDTDFATGCWVGIPPTELARWVYRLLEGLAAEGCTGLSVTTARGEAVLPLTIRATGADATCVRAGVLSILDEIRSAAPVTLEDLGDEIAVVIGLPAALHAPVGGVRA